MIVYEYKRKTREVNEMGLENMPDILTIKELCEFIKVSESTIRRAINDGSLKSFKAGKNVRIEKESVIEWLKEK
ncbi:helix-turn-helix domain-containing protein [Sedimentibacter hydroxybenzoicus DSM 7310]|uniref:Helix-turn-helix domain-containing protein n=1 Tax=Sedimentibacter hydroxybenzoicus DSM 7310 TaxID=1123245 RepID=A0A974GVI0_SEDHY|nr:helix-turn-helix domain-containing protein [Sedimentibacter hydroxybenzoicus]NYB73388.1 helix-turn-helix domain-containing protein [Sedimentibacter hydroxybenzoicus DSM 7310]